MNMLLHRATLLCLSLSAAWSVGAEQPDASKAADTCEAAVADTVKRVRGRAVQDVQFVGAKRALSPADGDDTGVKGEGRYRGSGGVPVSFVYSCAFNPKTGGTSGVVFKETSRGSAGGDEAWQPDLTHLSPEACEAAAAAMLKAKHPRVGRIVFGSDSRRLRPAPNDRTSLEGRGGFARAPGMNAVPFSYRCEIDTASGKVFSVQTSEQ